MNDPPERTRPWLLAAAVTWVVVVCLSGLRADLRLWGINHLAFTPWPVAVVLVVMLGATFIPPVARSMHHIAVGGFRRVLNGHAIILALVGIAAAAGFYAVRSATPLLGDGQLIANSFSDAFANRTPPFGTLVTATLAGELIAPGTILTFHTLIWLARQFGDASPVVVIQAFHSALGGAWIVLLLWTCRRYRFTAATALSFVALYVLGGGAVLFAGYLEYYTLLHLLLTGYVLAAVASARYRYPLWPAAAWLAAAFVVHVQACLFAPSLLYLVYSHTRPVASTTSLRRVAWVLAVSSLVISAGARWITPLAGHYLSFVATDDRYGVLSWTHLLDIANELALLLPILPLAIVAAILARARRSESVSAIDARHVSNGQTNEDRVRRVHMRRALWLMVLPCLLYLLMFKPDLGMARDWDLFAMAGLPIVPLMLDRFQSVERSVAGWTLARWAGTIALATALILTAAWLYTNASWKASATRLEAILAYDTARADYAYENLAILYDSRDERQKAAALMSQAHDITGSQRHMHRLAEYLELAGRRTEAMELLRRRIVAYPTEHKPLIQMMMILDRAGAIEDFLAVARDGCHLFPERYSFWYLRGQAAFRLGLRAEGVASFTRALSLNPEPPDRASMELNLRELRARGLWPSDSAALAFPVP